MNAASWGLVAVVLTLLSAVTGIGQLLRRQPSESINPAALQAFNLRVRSWWMMCCLLGAAVLFGNVATVLLFGLISFWALREYITLTPTRMGDHRTLFWVFFFFTPLQYVLVGWNKAGEEELYGLYSVLIPVYALLFIMARGAMSGDYKRFLERVAKIQTGLMICVYCLSFAPAVLYLNLVDSSGKTYDGPNAGLLFFFIVMVQLTDVLMYGWDRFFGKHVIASAISHNRTWEGLIGGAGCTMLVGAALSWATPFNAWQAGGMSLVIAVLAAAGRLTMSAIKRDRGVRDYGTLVAGHGGVLDRIDSICFAAPVFYHITRQFFSG